MTRGARRSRARRCSRPGCRRTWRWSRRRRRTPIGRRRRTGACLPGTASPRSSTEPPYRHAGQPEVIGSGFGTYDLVLLFVEPMTSGTGPGPWLRHGARAVILDDRDRVLLVRFEFTRPMHGVAGLWAAPGGGVEDGEDDRRGGGRGGGGGGGGGGPGA